MLVDPRGKSGAYRNVRGGCFGSQGKTCRSAFRNAGGQESQSDMGGMRAIASGSLVGPDSTDMVAAMLSSMHDNLGDLTPWLALNDHFTEQNDPRADFALLHILGSGRVISNESYESVLARCQKHLLAGILPLAPTVTNSIGMELVLIPPGIFRMGSPSSEAQRSGDEGPQRTVMISKPFYMGKHPVTRAEWYKIMDGDTLRADLPIDGVTWDECQEFCRKLSEKEGISYSLPTEAQWEYACRAGTQTAFAWGDTLTSQHANFNGNHPYGVSPEPNAWDLGRTSPVGSYIPNIWGLYDMHGNVLEWCQDRYGPYESGSSDVNNVLDYPYFRRGGWISLGSNCSPVPREQWLKEERSLQEDLFVDPLADTQGPDPSIPPSIAWDEFQMRIVRGGNCDEPGWAVRSAKRGYNWAASLQEGCRLVARAETVA